MVNRRVMVIVKSYIYGVLNVSSYISGSHPSTLFICLGVKIKR